MNNSKPIPIEMYYTLSCPNCKILQRLLDEVLPQFNDHFQYKKSLANSPIGVFKTMKLGIHTVPVLLINNEIVFKSVPTKQELINKLKTY